MRQFISKDKIDARGILVISGKDFKHLRRVLRVEIGDMINVRVLDGTLYQMTVCNISDTKNSITLQKCDTNEKDFSRGVSATEIDKNIFSVEYTLFQFIAKPVKMEIIIRQATECGIKNIVPVIGEYSQKGNILAMSSKEERFNRIIKEAREQSGSPVDTVVTNAMTIENVCKYWKEQTKLEDAKAVSAIVFYERKDLCKSLSNAILQNTKKIAIAVGSEGGISPKEIQALCDINFTPVHLKGNILRCETSAIYGIAAVKTTIELM